LELSTAAAVDPAETRFIGEHDPQATTAPEPAWLSLPHLESRFFKSVLSRMLRLDEMAAASACASHAQKDRMGLFIHTIGIARRGRRPRSEWPTSSTHQTPAIPSQDRRRMNVKGWPWGPNKLPRLPNLGERALLKTFPGTDIYAKFSPNLVRGRDPVGRRDGIFASQNSAERYAAGCCAGGTIH
jgi:hypothetical protein